MLNNLTQLDPSEAPPAHFFIGTVVFNEDPQKLERIKVTIPSLYSGTDPNLLPWVGKLDSGPVRNAQGSGSFGLVPKVGSSVFVVLLDGDPHYPAYFGSPVIQGQRVAEADVNYPNRYGWKDPSGNVFYVDTTSGNVTVKMVHASGATFTIDNAGNVDVSTPSNITFNAGGNFTVNASQIHLNP